jgi:hypothetical protein
MDRTPIGERVVLLDPLTTTAVTIRGRGPRTIPEVTRLTTLAPTSPRLALLLIVAAAAFASGALVFLALSWDTPLPDAWGFRGYSIIHAIGFTAVGALVALRRPANAIGWLLLSAGLTSAVGALALEYAVYAIVGRTVALPGGLFSAWLGSWIWVFYIVGVLPFVLLLFPDGRLLSTRWWPVGGAAIVEALITAAFMAFKPGSLQLAAYADNPFTPVASSLVDTLGTITVWLSLPVIGGASWSLVLRFRRSTGIERAQIKWLAFSVVPLAAAAFASIVLPDKLGQVLFVFLLLSVPVGVGIAVLRYRLYDIDLLINRTLVYGVTSASIAVMFFAGIVVLQALLRPLTSGSELAVAASTLASFALFQPLRRRIQEAVDRRFYRSHYDAERTLDSFAVLLRDEVDLDAVRADLLGSVRQTMAPAHLSLWLRERG